MKIICIGDSLTQGYPFKEKDSWPRRISINEGWETVNLGVNGETSYEILERTVKSGYLTDGGRRYGSLEKADICIIMCGSNDFLYTEVKVADVLKNIEKIAEICTSEGIKPVVGIPTLCIPEQASACWLDCECVEYIEVNRKLSQLRDLLLDSKERGKLNIIDFQEKYKAYNLYVDGLHPTSEGYRYMSLIVKEELNNEEK